MHRGWLLGGTVLTLLVASLTPRAAAGVNGVSKDPENPGEVAAAAKVRDELAQPSPNYEEIDKQLEELLKKTRDDEAKELGAAPPTEATSEADLREQMDRAIQKGKYDQAAYYLDRIKLLHDKPNPFGGWIDLTIWTIVVFLLLLFVLGKFAWTPMLQGLQKREHDIKAAVEDARVAREEATKLREEVQAERVRTEESRRTIIQKAESDAQRRAEEVTAAAEAKIKAERDQAMREMASAKDQALQDIWRQAADLAAAISTKAIRRNLTPDDHRRFVDEALAELRQTGNGHKTPPSA